MERNTRQRSAIKNALERAARPLLPAEVLAQAQAEAPRLSLATVYRNLNALLDEGWVKAVHLPGESARFELAHGHHHHHHHFQCRGCQAVYDIDACPGELSQLAPPGFVVQDHDLTLYGLCGACAPSV
jgi:Fur family ferric uptake transcriptional regulator